MDSRQVLTEIQHLMEAEAFSNAVITTVIIIVLWVLNLLLQRFIEKNVEDIRSKFNWKKLSPM